MFQMLACNAAVLTIAVIYFAWRDGYWAKVRRRATLHERVAYMMWTAANRA